MGMPNARTFVVVAGEASGDLLGGGLIRELRARYPEATFLGVAGPEMLGAGCEAWYQADELAVMGLAEVLSHLPRLLKIRRRVINLALETQPDCFIGIDAPDFNLPVARRLKAAGIKTVQYVSPSVWAWRAGRAARISNDTDLVLTLFPHEPQFYEQHGGRAHFVGHPLADQIPMEPDQSAARCQLGLPADTPVLALLPGSRMGEVKRLGPAFIRAASALRRHIPELTIVSPFASRATRERFSSQLQKISPDLPVTQLDRQASSAMIASDAVLLASGTAALEAMLCKRPMVIAYRIAGVTYAIVKGFKLLSGKYYALPNVLAGRQIAPEILQYDVTPENLAAAVLPLLRERKKVAEVKAQFGAIHQQLRRNASRSAAAAIAELIDA